MGNITGQCLCGACRYTFAESAILWQQLCYCDSCRRASGAGVVGWIGVSQDELDLTGDALTAFSARSDTVRQFCGICGSQLTYRSTQWPNEIHITAGTLAEPDRFVPTGQVHCAERPKATPLRHDLPAHPGQSSD
ncbi:GFA family protein [Actibacterium sp. 188UL27-1]|uniref:GFA family protein n=1 Tax=Actibacterium sp. 188UL27-1 TaxID=2786961 RepID=UPI001959D501|nr:GFA family protein [Actibacterium sp. 188UL27-1]MBM7068268.1 GFA family protein [Actibacterium sp. 188UL27-1]